MKKHFAALTIISLLIAAVFISCAPRYSLTVSSTPGGLVSVSPTSGPFHENEVVTLTAGADTGYYFAGWGNLLPWTEDYADSREISIIMPAEDIAISAGFAQRDKGWTFMIYMAGDNSLSSYTAVDINEIELGLYSALQDGNTSLANDVKVLVLVDQRGTGDSRLYLASPDNTSTIASSILSPAFIPASNELNMADPAVLSDFLEYGLTKYPSMNNALILWNHGGGVKSVDPFTSQSREICEDTYEGVRDFLYLNEVQTAVADALDPGMKLDIIGMDACLMGAVETAYEFRDLARYFTASMAEEWIFGWKYNLIFDKFTSPGNPPIPSVMADILVTQYRESTMVDSTTYPNTMTSVDLSKIAALKTAIDGLAASLSAANAKTDFEVIRDNSVFFHSPEPNPADYDQTAEGISAYEIAITAYEYDCLAAPYNDLYSLCVEIEKSGPTTETKTHAKDVLSTLSNAVVAFYGKSNELGLDYYSTDDSDANRGLSIFVSHGEKIYQGYSHYAYQWWYSDKPVRVNSSEPFIGGIDFCTSDTNGTVETWRELFEAWYDPSGIY